MALKINRLKDENMSSLIGYRWIEQKAAHIWNWFPLNSWVSSAYQGLIVGPLARLYIKGWWKDAAFETICNQLRPVPSGEAFWAENMTECQELLQTTFVSHMVWAETVLYFFVLLQGVRFVIRLF